MIAAASSSFYSLTRSILPSTVASLSPSTEMLGQLSQQSVDAYPSLHALNGTAEGRAKLEKITADEKDAEKSVIPDTRKNLRLQTTLVFVNHTFLVLFSVCWHYNQSPFAALFGLSSILIACYQIAQVASRTRIFSDKQDPSIWDTILSLLTVLNPAAYNDALCIMHNTFRSCLLVLCIVQQLGVADAVQTALGKVQTQSTAPDASTISNWLSTLVNCLLYIPAVFSLLFTTKLWAYGALVCAFLQYVLHLLYLLWCITDSHTLWKNFLITLLLQSLIFLCKESTTLTLTKAVDIDFASSQLGSLWLRVIVTSTILFVYVVAWLWSVGHFPKFALVECFFGHRIQWEAMIKAKVQ